MLWDSEQHYKYLDMHNHCVFSPKQRGSRGSIWVNLIFKCYSQAPRQRQQAQAGAAGARLVLVAVPVHTGLSLGSSPGCQLISAPKAFYSNLISAQHLSSPI